MELTSSGSGSHSAPTSDLSAWHFGGDERHLTSLCACFLCGGGRVNHTVVLYGHLNPLTLPQRAKNKLEPSEQLNPVQSKPWPSAFIQSPEQQARALCLCGCVSLFLPQHDLFLLLGVFLLVSLMSSALQIGSPADRPCSAVRLGGSLGAQAKARQQPVQHIPARVSASLSLSCFPLPPKQALLPTLSLRHVFWVVMVPGGGKGGVHLEEVSLTPAPHPCCTPVLHPNLLTAPGHACALASDPSQISLVLCSLFISLHPPSAHVLGTLGQSQVLR